MSTSTGPGRPERASPAEGYPQAHAKEQARIVTEALNISLRNADLRGHVVSGEIVVGYAAAQ